MNELFDMVWDRMDSRGYVDAEGSAEYNRLRDAWMHRGQVEMLVRFIYQQCLNHGNRLRLSFNEDRIQEIVNAVVMPDLEQLPMPDELGLPELPEPGE